MMSDNKEITLPDMVAAAKDSMANTETDSSLNNDRVKCPKVEDSCNACSKLSNLSLGAICDGESRPKSLDNHSTSQTNQQKDQIVDNNGALLNGGDNETNMVPVNSVVAAASDLNSNFWNDSLASTFPPSEPSHNELDPALLLLNFANENGGVTTGIANEKENEVKDMEPGVSPMETEDNVTDGQPEPPIELKLCDIKTDFAEFDYFVLLFLYVIDVEDCAAKFDTNSVSLTFKTNYDVRKGANPDTTNEQKTYHYVLNMKFENEIVPEKCSWKAKKRSIEIRLEKKIKKIWGLVTDKCHINSNNGNADKTAVIPESVDNPNTWTPCTRMVLTNNSVDNKGNNMALVRRAFDVDDNDDDLNANADGNGKTKFYGFTGLVNMGNTCFINSVLQCLANTDPLKEYFLSNKYLDDINTSNPLGSKGIVAKEFAQFLTQLWISRQSSFPPNRLKALISDKVSSFFDYSQHDAQEFMSFLLDAIHEDLKKPNQACKTVVEKDNGDDEETLMDHDVHDCLSSEMAAEVSKRLMEMADKAWNQYRANNSSIITDLFCGQFKSILTCPDCMKKSIIFDPFLFVPLPIPPPKITYQIICFARDHATGMCKKISRFSLKMAQHCTVNDLLNYIHRKGVTPPAKYVRLMQQQPEESMHVKFFNVNWVLSDHYRGCNNNPQPPLLLFELPNDTSDEYMELCVIQREYRSSDDHSSPIRIQQVGLPFFITLKRSMMTYSHLCAVLCSYARHSVVAYRQASNDPASNTRSNRFNVQTFTPKNHPMNSSRNDFSGNGRYSSSTPELPHLVYYKTQNLTERDTIAPFLLHTWIGDHKTGKEITPPIIYRYSGSDCSENESEDVAEMVINNDQVLNLKDDVFLISMDWITLKHFDDFPIAVNLSVLDYNNLDFQRLVDAEDDISLDDCLRCFIEPETLGPQNCWRCPKCKVNREASKQLSFWRLPPILVIQLKRFRTQTYYTMEKITSLVKYPVNGLNLNRYCSNLEKTLEPIYDLYGVVNHMGTPFFGHYMAYARSSHGELGWRSFDDTIVESVSEQSVVSPHAYILFYKRRDT